MSQSDRDDLKIELMWCLENHGPWDVLDEVARALKPAFEKLPGADQPKARRAVQALDDAAHAGRADQ